MARHKEKTRYGNKVKCLMMQCMRPILKKLVRRTIKKKSPHGRRSLGIDAFLAHNKGRIENKLIEIDHNNMYRNILYPPDEETPRTDIHEWDLTLYQFILTDICRISRPQTYYFKQLLGIRNDLCKSRNSAITRDICKDYRKRMKRLRSKFYRHLRDDDLKEKIEKRANEIESGEMSSTEEEEVLKRWTDLEVSKVMIAAEKKSGLDKYVILRKLLSNCCAEVMRALVINTAKRNVHSYDRNGHWSLDIFLRKNKHRIDRRIQTVDKLERPMDILFPRRGKTKLEEWDVTLLCFVLLNVCYLDDHMADYIADIRRARNEIAHSSTVLNLTDSEYMAYVGRLKGSISVCLNYIDDRGLSDFINGTISDTEFGEVDKNETIRQLQRDREDLEKREKAREVHETIQKELSEIVKKFKDIGMPEQQVELVIKNSSHELEKKLSKCIVENINRVVKSEQRLHSSSEDDIELAHAIENWIEKWKSKGWVITEAIDGSVLLQVRCSTFDDVCHMYNTHKGEGSNIDVSDLQTTLNEAIGVDVKLFLVMYDDEMERFMEKIVSSLLNRSKALTPLNTSGDRYDTKVRLYLNRCSPDAPALTDVDLEKLDDHLRRIADVIEKKHDMSSVSLHVCRAESRESKPETDQLTSTPDSLDFEMDSSDNEQTMEMETDGQLEEIEETERATSMLMESKPYTTRYVYQDLSTEIEETETIPNMSKDHEPQTTGSDHHDLQTEKVMGAESTDINMKTNEIKSEVIVGQQDDSNVLNENGQLKNIYMHYGISSEQGSGKESTSNRRAEEIRDPDKMKYRNWVRGGLAYKYLKEGIEGFSDEVVKQEHGRILQIVKKSPSTICTQCDLRSLRPMHKSERDSGRYSCPLHQTNCNCLYPKTKPCPNRICDVILEEVLNAHRTNFFPNTKNTDIHAWCTNPWEIAKCFISAPGYANTKTAYDSDATGLLHVIYHNKMVVKEVPCEINKRDVFSTVLKRRNEIIHSPTMELRHEELNDCIDDIISILADGKKLNGRHDAQQAVKKLKMLKEEYFIITTNDELDACRDALSSITHEIEELEHKIEELKKGVQDTNYGNGVKIDRSTDMEDHINKLYSIRLQRQNTLNYLLQKQDLQYHLVQMYREHYTRTSISPFRIQDKYINIADVYVSPHMVSDVTNKSETESRNSTSNHTLKSLCYMPIHGYRDIFQANSKNILIVGKTGTGKSAYCKMMIENWCQSVSGFSDKPVLQFRASSEIEKQLLKGSVNHGVNTRFDDVDEEYNFYRDISVNSVLGKTCEPAIHDDDINQMKKFDFLFFVPLQRMSKLNLNIIDMTKRCCKNFTSEGLIKEIFEKESERCLVLVDGLDEWTPPNKLVSYDSYGVSKRDTAKHAVIITLSRPSAVKSLKSSQYDQKIILQGINTQTINIFIEKYMSKLNLRDCCLEDFIVNARKVKHIEKTPLLLMQLICMYADGNTGGNSVSDIYSNLADALSRSENREEK